VIGGNSTAANVTVVAVTYRWRYLRTDGTDAPGPDMVFEDQAGAEDWLGTHWAELLETGVDQVTLLDTDTEVYGPMSLHPPTA
jgi:hypothetical protein